MNDNKICFIACVNDTRYYEESLYYLNQLNVPQGFEVEILSIEEAHSMTSGYNEAMNISDAKYKVYMHQDVFIVNKNFISDILDVFQDKSIGMIGMIGSPKLPDSCIMWDGERVGRIYSSNFFKSGEGVMNGETKQEFVEAIDGLMMITQYDLPWREDLFDGWDFYDISQSFEFRRKGYKVVIPKLNDSWCLHDDGIMNLENYYKERKKFVQEYINRG